MITMDVCIDDEIHRPSGDFFRRFQQGRCRRDHGIVDQHDLIVADKQRDVAAAKSIRPFQEMDAG